MTITKRPKQHTSESILEENAKASSFIESAGNLLQKSVRQNRIPIMLRFDAELLKKVDESSHRRGISRSSWIQYVISRALDNGEG
jgi:hypothetical protein